MTKFVTDLWHTGDSPVYKIEIKKASYEIVDSMLCLGPSN